MIYLFDKHKKLKGTVRARHTIALLYERERNGIYSVSAEIPVSLTDKRTVYNYHKKVKGSDFIGHYDREGRFQLHKIAAVDIENTSIFIKGIHLFFDEAKAGAIIRERRFRGGEIIDGARAAFDPIGWTVVDFDISDQKDYSFYNVSPLEARAILVETFGYEFDYWLDFDGKNLRNKQIAVKKKIGKETNKRYNYGHNVLSIKVEQDYSEIYTAVIGRGKGEDLDDSDGYGRRIEFTDVEWKKPSKPLDKAKGSRTLIDPTATQLFGYHDGNTVAPRTKVEIFSDIEDEAELLQASYDWLMDNNVPKAVFSLNVPDGDGLDLGDSVHVIYRDIDLIKSTRVTKVIDDLVSGNRSVEFGDTAYFDTDRRISGLKADLKRVGGSTSSRITRLKAEFDRRFDEEVQQWKDDFEQALIDAEADVESMRAEMTEEFETAQREFEEEFNQSVADAKQHAEEAAEAKAKEVQDNLDSFAGRHEQLVEELQDGLIDIDGELADARADVSGILGRLTIVDGDISGITGSLNGIKDSLSEVEGTLSNTKTQLENQISDARTELEQSISNTRNELENKIDETENALNQVGEDLGNAKTDLQNQLDEARAELDGLEIGGRNLIKDSNTFTGRWIKFGDSVVSSEKENDEYTHVIAEPGSSHIAVMRLIDELKREYAGEELTLSFDLINHGEDFILLHNWSGGRDSDYIPSGYNQRYKYTGTFSQSAAGQIQFRTHTNPPENGLDFSIRNLQVEIGNVATDWTPAPEDAEQKITNINQTITNIEGELSSKVDQTEVDALKGTVTRQGTLLTQTADEVSSKAEKSVVDTLTGRVSNAESSVTQNAEEIAKKLTKSVYDEDKKDTDAKITQWSNTASETAEGLTRVIGRVSETESGIDTAQTRIEAEAGRIDGLLSRTSNVEGKVRDAELAIEANADGLALRATKTEVEQAIDGIEVGGRNLVLDSEWNERNSKYLFKQFETSEDLIVGEVYTITIYGELGEDRSSFRLYTSNGYSQFQKPDGTGSGGTLSKVKEGVYQATFKHYFAEGYEPSRHDLLRICQMTSTDSSESYVSRVKLEKGNKATDWTPAPEEAEAKITKAQADIIVNANEIATKVSNSQFDSLSGKVSDNSSAITQTANEVRSKVTQAEVDYSMTHIENGDIKTVKDVASFQRSSSGVTGAILIKTNLNGRAMARVFIKGYNYTTNNTNIDVVISFYNYSTSILQHGYTSTGSKKIERVRIFRDSNGFVNILLNDFDSTWSYPAIAVDRFDMSYVTDWSWGEGWEMSVVESMPGDVADITEVKGQDYGSIVSKHETDIVQNAKEIALKASQSELNSVTGRVSSAESQLSVQSGQIALRATKKELDGVAGRVSATEASLTVMDGEISSVVGRVTANETDISSVVQDVSSITSTVASLEGDVASQGSKIEQTENVISSKVWMEDIASIGANLIPFSDTQNQSIMVENWDFLSDGNSVFYTGVTSSGFFTLRNARSGTTLRMRSQLFDRLVSGKEYTLSFHIQRTSGVNSNYNYTWINRPSHIGSFRLGDPTRITDNGDGTYLHEYVFTSDYTGKVGVDIGSYTTSGQDLWLRVKEPKLERGSKRTPYMTAFSVVEQRAEELSLRVQELSSIDGEEMLSQSDISVLPDRVLIGSQNIGARDMASILAVSPSAIDIITDAMNLTGNLNVKGQIESITMSAISANFSEVQAAVLKSSVIKTTHLDSEAVTAAKIKVDTTLVNKLIANSVLANEVKALSLDAVEANIGSIRSSILTTNVILSDNINASLALIDKIFSENMYVRRMTGKSAFISEIQAIEITANKINGGVLSSLDQNMTWDLVNNVQDHYVANTVKFHAYGNATTMYKSNQTVGMAFLKSDGGLPRLVIGGNSSPRLSPDHPAWNGIDITPDKHEMNITADKLIFSSEGGDGSEFLRAITLDLYRDDGQVYVTPLNQRGYHYHMGSRSNSWRTMWTEYFNNMRIYENEYGMYIRSNRSGHNVFLRISPNSVSIMEDNTILARLWQR